jgi:hypothetical protein
MSDNVAASASVSVDLPVKGLRGLIYGLINFVFGYNMLVTVAMSSVLGMLALLDSLASHTTPLNHWRWSIVTLLGLATTSVFWSILRAGHTKHSYPDYVAMRARNLEPTEARLLTTSISQNKPVKDLELQWSRNRVFAQWYVIYSSGLVAFTGLAAIYCIWLYDYTSRLDGYQTKLDKGFDRVDAAPFNFERKLLFLTLLQLGMLWSLIMAVLYRSLGFHFPSLPSLKPKLATDI